MRSIGCLDEERVLALVEGRLDAQEVEAAEAHLHGCAACAALVTSAAMLVPSDATAAARAWGAGLAPGARFGRYTILSLLGRGGMGEVHAAYDPQLDRRVALKVVQGPRGEDDGSPSPSVDTEGRLRLLREAKAIAKLAHPNVIAVHDAGEHDGRVFIAMEYVDGQTLDVWMRAVAPATRPWPEVVDMFLHAGQGLAAAHEAGVVHRDFKPQNVMVGKDGRVRVMDFGLATAPVPEVTPAPAGEGPPGWARALGAKGLTRTGTLLGTPIYMAPEQFKGERVNERTDQFSFCVALYEALYGERPFPSTSFAELSAAVLAGRVRERPARSNVQSWLRAVVLRGLAPRREDRHPSMAALLEQLGRNPARRRRWIAGAAGVALAAVAAVSGVSWKHARAAGACRLPAARLGALWEPPGATNAPRRAAVRASFLGVPRSYAADSLAVVANELDAFAARWTAAYADACDATHLRGQQSVQALELRTSCLDRALGAFGALTQLLSKADAEVVTQAVVAIGALPDVARCADVNHLMASLRSPVAPKARQEVEQIRTRLAELGVLRHTGDPRSGLVDAERVLTSARATGFEPVVAEALLTLASLQEDIQPDGARTSSREAFWLALRVGEDELAERAAHQLLVVEGINTARYAEARLWGTMTETLLTRLGPGHDLEWGWYWQDEGGVAFREGRLAAARAAIQRALDIKRKVLGPDHPDVAISTCSLAAVCLEITDLTCALARADQGIVSIEKGFGPHHPDLGVCLQNKGETLSALGKFREALAAHERARAIWIESMGPENALVGYALNGMGVALLGLGDGARAKDALQRALAIREKTGSDPVLLAESRFSLARALQRTGEPRRALALATQARQAYVTKPELAPRLRAVDAWLAERPR